MIYRSHLQIASIYRCIYRYLHLQNIYTSIEYRCIYIYDTSIDKYLQMHLYYTYYTYDASIDVIYRYIVHIDASIPQIHLYDTYLQMYLWYGCVIQIHHIYGIHLYYRFIYRICIYNQLNFVTYLQMLSIDRIYLQIVFIDISIDALYYRFASIK